MKKLILLSTAVAAIVAAVVLFTSKTENRPEAVPKQALSDAGPLIGYAVCKDKKVYKIDLSTAQVVAVSEPIQGLGRPTMIDLDPSASLLYIGSDLGQDGSDYAPLSIVDVSDDRFIVHNQFFINSANEADPQEIFSVLSLKLSPINEELYVGYASPGHKLLTVIDRNTGKEIRQLDIPVPQGNNFSPDGKRTAEIYPSGEKVVSQNGEESVRTWKGGVAVRSLVTGDWVSRVELVDNEGLQPPWDSLSDPFLYLRNGISLEIYNRDSGKMLSSIDLQELTGLAPTHTDPVVVEDGKLVVFSMVDSGQKGYVVLINTVEESVVSRTEVGEYPTNLVVMKSVDE